MTKPVTIVGGGLAGSEAAWQLAKRNVPVTLYEMRPIGKTLAHQTNGFAELVCSNSFRSSDAQSNAVGLLQAEMRLAGSLIMACADRNQIETDDELTVDRNGFSNEVTKSLENEPLITIIREEYTVLPSKDDGRFIIASGPFSSDALSKAIVEKTNKPTLTFFNAVAPILHYENIDMEVAWFQSRFDIGVSDNADCINCPMTKEQYYEFVRALLAGEKTHFKNWESTPYFEGCMPIEDSAKRSLETLRFGAMKPIGLTNKHKPAEEAFAVVQLQQDNAFGSLYNMVGFQTRLKHEAQAEIFRKVPGLQKAEFERYGDFHRNTFINSPNLLDSLLRLKCAPHLRFAGQITGCAGYVESASTGLIAGKFAADEYHGITSIPPPETTAFGALISHINGSYLSDGNSGKKRSFQPMNINFGLFPPVEIPKEFDGKKGKSKEKTMAKRQTICTRAISDCKSWLNQS